MYYLNNEHSRSEKPSLGTRKETCLSCIASSGQVALGWKHPISSIQIGKLLAFTLVHSVRGLTVASFLALRLSAGFSFEARGRTFRPVVHYALSGTLVSYNSLQISFFVCYFRTWSCVGSASLISENCLWGKDLCP